jgi:hypothetical protein
MHCAKALATPYGRVTQQQKLKGGAQQLFATFHKDEN